MITITEKPWIIEIDCSNAGRPTDEIGSALRDLGVYTSKTFSPSGTSEDVQISTMTKVGDNILTLPKGKLMDAEKTLKRMGEEVTTVLRGFPEPDWLAIARAYPNPSLVNDPSALPEKIRLESLQVGTMTEGLEQGRSGAYDYGMGGGKTVIIAAHLAAYPDLRPAIVTSAASGDSQQLASKLAVMTGEKVNLQGCTGGKLTSEQKRKLFVKKPKDATIICGSHALYSKLEKPVKDENDAKLVEMIKTAKLIIIDEAHECCTMLRIGALMRTNPQVVFAFTATWQKNWSKLDRLLADLLATTRAPLGVVSHTQVQDTGRVTPVEIKGWTLDRREWIIPTHRLREWRGYNIMQREVEFNPARNIFLAYLCNHLMEVNAAEGRGCILVFANTIGHCKRVVKELCQIRGLKFSEEACTLDSIYIVNGSLTNAEKAERMTAMAQGKTKIVFSTETLSRGIDMNTIYDVVDINGGSKLVSLVQKCGRAVRPDGDEKLARLHTVIEGQLQEYEGKDRYILESCSRNKIKTLEANFGVRAEIVSSFAIPFRSHATVNG